MNYAYEFAKEIVRLFQESADFPYDTGNLKYHGTNAVADTHGADTASVVFGGETAEYAYYLQYNLTVGATARPNRHYRFVNRILEKDVLPALRAKYGG